MLNDKETGFDYDACSDSIVSISLIGSARYYNNKLGLWMSVDPKEGKYPSATTYEYCFNNPLRVVDSDGQEGWDKVARCNQLNSGFGMRTDPVTKSGKRFHEGVDINVPIGTAVRSAAAGKVIKACNEKNGGNTIIIDNGNGVQTAYCHLSEINVKVGEKVTEDKIIGKSGNTGERCTGPHLHFAVYLKGVAVDPQIVGDVVKYVAKNEPIGVFIGPQQEQEINSDSKATPTYIKPLETDNNIETPKTLDNGDQDASKKSN